MRRGWYLFRWPNIDQYGAERKLQHTNTNNTPAGLRVEEGIYSDTHPPHTQHIHI